MVATPKLPCLLAGGQTSNNSCRMSLLPSKHPEIVQRLEEMMKTFGDEFRRNTRQPDKAE